VEKKSLKVKRAEEDYTYAYDVLEALVVGMRAVASQPGLLMRFLYEYAVNADRIAEALEILVPEEHLGVFGEILRASVLMCKAVLSEGR